MTVVRRRVQRPTGKLVVPGDLFRKLKADSERLERLDRVMTLVDNGTICIGWDICGGCNTHIRSCDCPDGPTPPSQVRKLMES